MVAVWLMEVVRGFFVGMAEGGLVAVEVAVANARNKVLRVCQDEKMVVVLG